MTRRRRDPRGGAHLDPDRLTTLVVGDLDAIGADLAALGFGEPVVLAPKPSDRESSNLVIG